MTGDRFKQAANSLVLSCLCLLCVSIGITAVTKAANAMSQARMASAIEQLAEDNRLQRLALERATGATHDR